MTDTHFELMQRLQWQRDELARAIWMFSADEYAALRTEAVDWLEDIHCVIQNAVGGYSDITVFGPVIVEAVDRKLERLRTALIAMPQADYAAAESGLERTTP